MEVLVVQKQVPDIVEELVIAPDGKGLQENEIRYVPNELDQHALEQAILLKGRHGGRVDVLAIGGKETLDSLAEALAKGADGVLRLPAEAWDRRDNRKLSAHLAPMIKDRGYDLILTGVQAVDDVNGSLGGFLGGRLGLPYVGGLAGMTLDPARQVARVWKEYPGGTLAVIEVSLPAVLGILSTDRAPCYVPISRVMQAKRTMKVQDIPCAPPSVTGLMVYQVQKPERKMRATMLEGDADAVTNRLVTLFKESGLL